MDSVRILHCADFHLGVDRLSIGNRSKARRAEVRRTFRTVTELAKKEDVQFLVIAGDLFDSVRLPEDIFTEVRDAFAAISPIKVVICSGNHDPATPDSVYMRNDFWSDNVIIFSGELTKKELPELGVRLVGAGFGGTYSTSPMLRRITFPQDDYINIGVLHGEIVAEGAGSEYNPVSERRIEGCGLHYLALGHIHKRSEPKKAGVTTYAYSGCPEGQNFGETGTMGVYIADISHDYCDVRFVPVCVRVYTNLDVDISSADDRDEAAELIRKAMEAENGDEYRNQLYRVILKGAPAEGVTASLDELAVRLSDIWYLELKDRTHLYIDEDEMVTENSLRGIFVQQMVGLKGKVPEEQRELALRLGLKAFNGEIDDIC